MKVLQLCSKPPYPAKDGGCIATLSISEGLINNGVELKILSIATQKHPFYPDAFPSVFISKTNFEAININTEIKIVSGIMNLFTNKSYNLNRFYSSEFEHRLKTEFSKNSYDIIWLEGLYLIPYLHVLRESSKAKIILRAHNIEFKIWEKLAENEGTFLKKKYLKLLSNRIKVEELDAYKTIDGIAAITDEEAKEIALYTNKPVESIPLGFATQFNITASPGQTCLFIGSMEWLPNVEGIRWFLEKVWPRVIKELPEAKFYLAGKAMPDNFKHIKLKGLINLGEINEAESFWSNSQILIAPLFSGGGLKVKLVEALMKGKAIVATPLASIGIPNEIQKVITIAQSEIEFSEKLISLMKNNSLQTELGNQGKIEAAKIFGIDVIDAKVLRFMYAFSRNQHP